MGIPKLAGMAALLMVLIAACGGSTPPPSAAPNTTPGPVGTTATLTLPPVAATNPPVGGTIDVCSLLSTSDLNAATGKVYRAGTSNTADFDCRWDTAEGDLIIAYIQANPFGFNFHKDNTPAGGVDLTVNGHPAFYNAFQSNALSSTLWVDLGGGREFSVWYTDSQAIATQLAEIAVSKL